MCDREKQDLVPDRLPGRVALNCNNRFQSSSLLAKGQTMIRQLLMRLATAWLSLSAR